MDSTDAGPTSAPVPDGGRPDGLTDAGPTSAPVPDGGRPDGLLNAGPTSAPVPDGCPDGLTDAGPISAPGPGTYVLGIRHHGPGSARAVAAELDRIAPDAILIEGPADASDLIASVVAEGMSPPVALLGYAADDPSSAAFWPFAVFSPEWQAMTWAVRNHVPVEFCDLPAAVTLAARDEDAGATGVGDDVLIPVAEAGGDAGTPLIPEAEAGGDAGTPLIPEAEATKERGSRGVRRDENPDATTEDETTAEHLARTDPIALLAEAAGYDDPERWWDDVVETRSEQGIFEAIAEAMTVLRDEVGDHSPDAARDERREAYMRQVLRKTLKRTGVHKVAVICGAWHVPALRGKLPPATADSRILKGMKKTRTRLAWVPWTHSRLSFASGYAAGVVSPGWYHHLFTADPDTVVAGWFTGAAQRLRAQDLPVSSAHIIESVRLAQTLATMRGRQLAGLAELDEATLAVLCEGDRTLADLVHREVVMGERLGSVPEDSPVVPLQADLTSTVKSLRLKQSPAAKEVVLDLRKPNDLAKSILLHRLSVLGIDWGQPLEITGTGTFKEGWLLTWRPELVIEVVLASVWGTTVSAAANAKIGDRAAAATQLSQITELLEQTLLADAADALGPVLAALHARAAVDHDVDQLMAALPAIGRTQRYGDVRGTDVTALGAVARSLLLRVCTGLPAAVTGLNDEAAQSITERIGAVHETVALLAAVNNTAVNNTAGDNTAGDNTAGQGSTDRQRWYDVLRSIADRTDVNGVLVGRITRLLTDADVFDSAEAARRLGLALSRGATPVEKARWIEGFLGDSGLLLIHDPVLLPMIDSWLAGLDETAFVDALPLLRRTFGPFDAPVRRGIAEQLARSGPGEQPVGVAAAHSLFDPELAGPAVAALARILGDTPVGSTR